MAAGPVADGSMDLLAAIGQAAHRLAAPALRQMAEAVAATDGQTWSQRKGRLQAALVQPAAQKEALQITAAWQAMARPPAAEAVALAILSAVQVQTAMAERQQIELVWTGPATTQVPMRATDQVLLGLIGDATQRLDIMSFAVHQLPSVSAALVEAADRAVDLRIYLETPDSSLGKMATNTIRNLGQGVAARAKIYVWPQSRRKRSVLGATGLLHAKLAVADGRLLFVSSANLTEHALHRNMEMGLLVRGGEQPAQVVRHLDALVQGGVLEPAPEPDAVPALSPAQVAAWEDALDLAAESCRLLLGEARRRGLPPPTVGYELAGAGGRVVAGAELAWERARVAVLLEGGAADAAAFDAAGWRTYDPTASDAILAKLGA